MKITTVTDDQKLTLEVKPGSSLEEMINNFCKEVFTPGYEVEEFIIKFKK